MDFWRDNFIANMYGPYFLGFYAMVIALALVIVRWRLWLADRSQQELVGEPPEPPDPLDLALLRGDTNEVLRLTVVELVQRGYLRSTESRFLGLKTGEKMVQASAPPDARFLSPLARAVFDVFQSPRTAEELFADKSLLSWFQVHCGEAERRLAEFRLINADEVKRAGRQAAWVAVLVVLSLGGYKLAAALDKGRTNVGFLIVMGIVGVIALIAASSAPRLSRRGKAYLAKLQARYSRLKSSLTTLSQPVDPGGLLFAVALFGLPALQGTPYETLIGTFRKSSSSGGCGGGGCGGGGCGGGGCGGCGG